MAEETGKTDQTKTDHTKTPGGTVYKQVAPAGLAAEMTADNPVAAQTLTALGRWLTEKLAPSPLLPERVATLSGLSVADLTSLMEGHPRFRLDTDHVQRIATALVEAQVIAHAEEVWTAIGSGPDASDYIVPPAQVVQAMSDTP